MGAYTAIKIGVDLQLCYSECWEILEYDHGFKKASEQCCPVMLFMISLRWYKQINGVWGEGGGGGGGGKSCTSIKIVNKSNAV